MAVCGLVLTGCAQFDDSAADGEYREAPELTPQQGPQPELPEAPGGSGGPEGGSPADPEQPEKIPPPQGCKDHDPRVIGTCMDTVAAVAALPPVQGGYAALAGEQGTGRVWRVTENTKKRTFAKLPVKAVGGGGLTGLALSPTYAEDGLVFAYVTTASDNRVVRFTKGGKPRAILTGIPKGSSGNRGSLAVDPSGALLVATGDAGDPSAAKNVGSLAGKVLRIDTSGKAASGNPKEGSRVLARGLHTPGGICASADGAQVWVTDRAPKADAIHLLDDDGLGAPVWSWKDKPGVAGCFDKDGGIVVATSTKPGTQNLDVDENGSVKGKPTVTLDGEDDGYGLLGGMDFINPTQAVVGTVNKDGGKPVSSDDRAVVIDLEVGSAGGGKD